jgi:hypothetical protein
MGVKTTQPPRICCLCWLIDNRLSPAIDGWEGIAVCREHMAETLVRVGGLPTVTPTPGFAAPVTLQ